MIGISPYPLPGTLPVSSVLSAHTSAEDWQELTALYDAYNNAIKAGDTNTAQDMSTAEMIKEINILKQAAPVGDPLILLKSQVPDSYEVEHVNRAKDGKSAELYLLIHLSAMKNLRPRDVRLETLLTFKKENGAWKLGRITPLADMTMLTKPKDLVFNEKEADTDSSGFAGGRILKREFKTDHTLIMLRVMDEELAVFLPRKEELEKAGMNPDNYARWKLCEFTGHPHKTDKLKFFGTGVIAAE